MNNQKSSSGVPTSNVFYTFGFLLLYIHMCMNIVSLFLNKEFFHSQNNFEVKLFGNANLSLTLSLEETLLVGGFILFTIIGVILERMRLIILSRKAEVGWKYRNRIKQYYSIIAIVLVIWIAVQGYVVQKNFDWVWLSAALVILLYSIFLVSYPRIKKVRS